jgi:hypothetical protein
MSLSDALLIVASVVVGGFCIGVGIGYIESAIVKLRRQ